MDVKSLIGSLFKTATEEKCKITLEYETGVQMVVYGSDILRARDEAAEEEKRQKRLLLKRDKARHPTPLPGVHFSGKNHDLKFKKEEGKET